MGKEKYLADIEGIFKKSPVVSYSSIERIVKSKKNVRQYVKQLVKNLIARGRIKRLAKGYYTAHDEPSLAVFCFKPAYLGLQDALSFHNLWEQETIPVIITARKVRQGIRNISGANVLIRRIDKKYLFGFDYCKSGDFYLPYSDIEKTFIDMVYFRENIGKDVIKAVKKSMDRKKFESYLKVYPPAIKRNIFKKMQQEGWNLPKPGMAYKVLES